VSYGCAEDVVRLVDDIVGLSSRRAISASTVSGDFGGGIKDLREVSQFLNVQDLARG
jgi:hypothetical protein